MDKIPAWEQHPVGWNAVLHPRPHAVSQWLMHAAVSQQIDYRELEMKGSPLPTIIAPSDPEIESVLSVLAILGSPKATTTT